MDIIGTITDENDHQMVVMKLTDGYMIGMDESEFLVTDKTDFLSRLMFILGGDAQGVLNLVEGALNILRDDCIDDRHFDHTLLDEAKLYEGVSMKIRGVIGGRKL